MKYNRPQDIENPDTIYGKIVSRVKEKSQVLEFGPSGGWMTQYLSEEKDCYIDIVEIDPEGFSQASRFARENMTILLWRIYWSIYVIRNICWKYVWNT